VTADTERDSQALENPQLRWWHAYWQHVGLMRLSSAAVDRPTTSQPYAPVTGTPASSYQQLDGVSIGLPAAPP
jgi:hypothetical protein